MGKIAVNIGKMCRKNYSRPNEGKANEVPHVGWTNRDKRIETFGQNYFFMRTNFEILVMIRKIILAKTFHLVRFNNVWSFFTTVSKNSDTMAGFSLTENNVVSTPKSTGRRRWHVQYRLDKKCSETRKKLFSTIWYSHDDVWWIKILT